MKTHAAALTGKYFIGGKRAGSGRNRFRAVDPASGRALEPGFCEAGAADADRALKLADAARGALRTAPPGAIADLLERIADGLEAAGGALVERARLETALPYDRLRQELARTSGQCRAFAELAREGSWVQARIDHPLPDRRPLPKPDIRTLFTGVGPVAVFGASNFPLAMSVAGTDTVAAFAARCPVAVKGHPAHPGTCELAAGVIAGAVERSGLPPGMFSMLQSSGFEAGLALVRHPLTAAVSFTGSLRGGRALFDAAAARPVPIPVYAEMGSVNPIFILPGAAASRPEAIAEGFVRSLNMGAGQYCTNPGMVLALRGPSFDRLLAAICQKASEVVPACMLHAGIQTAYDGGAARLAATPGVKLAACAKDACGPGAGPKKAHCRIFTADAALLSRRRELFEEVFGPSTIIFRCRDTARMLETARAMPGSLTATVHGTEEELLSHGPLLRALERRAGRLLFNGFPTGLEPCPALHHGGPYPATTHSFFTSVGTAAIYRYVRPVCYQGFPDAALPEELREANPRGIRRLVDGKLA